ncbi:MAG: hypothetical protein IJF54_05755 [Clostridia bacterium]|nr:hypothetical protein [Clostridia bacterium]
MGRKSDVLTTVFAVIGVIATVAAAAYEIYTYLERKRPRCLASYEFDCSDDCCCDEECDCETECDCAE